jgi:hypothetical protein
MGMPLKIFATFLIGIFLSGCTGKPASSRKLEVSFGALEAGNVGGGAILRVENAATGAYTDVDLTVPPFSVMVADGKWNFYFVGFLGPGSWAGGTECGGALGVTLGPTTSAIDITVNAGNCGSSPYTALIATKVSKWDKAIWNQAKWGI